MRYVCAAPARRAASSTARCSTCVIADGTQISTRARYRRLTPARWNSKPDQALRDLEVGDRATAQRPHRDDVAGRAPDHLPRVVPHREHVLAAAVERDDGRLVEDDPLAPRVDKRVGGAEVDGEVPSQTGALPARRDVAGPDSGSGSGRGATARRPRRNSSMLASIPVRGRLRTTTTVMPTALATSTKIRNCTRCPSPRPADGARERADRLRAASPSRSRRPSAPASRSARSPSRGRCTACAAANASARCGLDTTTATAVSRQREPAEAVHDRDPVDRRPLLAQTGDDLAQPPAGGFFVGLVRERDDIGAALGVIADDAEEGDDRAATGRGRPRNERVERRRAPSSRASHSRASAAGDRTGTTAV